MNPFRGVFSPKYKRKVLFTKVMTFKTKDLPKRKLVVTLERKKCNPSPT